MNAKCYSYVIPRDFGFAPNPFGRECTLATCKPLIRKNADVGDWILGTSSIQSNRIPRLVYIMKVTNKISFNEYYHDPDYQYKKPVMNGSLKKMYGDNIYHFENVNGKPDKWIQDDSHHSLKDGSTNYHNLNRDTSTTDKVLISNHFYYFGEASIEIHCEMISKICKRGPGYRVLRGEIVGDLIKFISGKYEPGLIGQPAMFSEKFAWYDGKT